MAFSKEQIEANRRFFAEKLAVEKQKTDVAHWAKGEKGASDFVLLDVRDRGSFNKEHIAGATSAPLAELPEAMKSLSRDREYVAYCWSHF